jgi:hypothetical protein
MTALRPRKSPCASCPYRQDTPSGVWAETEYEKLRAYDGSTGQQAEHGAWGVFLCHNDPGESVCAGWAALADVDTLALRMARRMDPDVDVRACLDYSTDVPLWPSGAAAAEHGQREIEAPSDKALGTVRKIVTVRAAKGKPVEFRE